MNEWRKQISPHKRNYLFFFQCFLSQHNNHLYSSCINYKIEAKNNVFLTPIINQFFRLQFLNISEMHPLFILSLATLVCMGHHFPKAWSLNWLIGLFTSALTLIQPFLYTTTRVIVCKLKFHRYFFPCLDILQWICSLLRIKTCTFTYRIRPYLVFLLPTSPALPYIIHHCSLLQLHWHSFFSWECHALSHNRALVQPFILPRILPVIFPTLKKSCQFSWLLNNATNFISWGKTSQTPETR